MRSPDPVNWTVPLDTGKTFTVTQNVRDGDIANIVRPHSEIKVSTPVDQPARLLPQAPQSAPPELSEQAKMDGMQIHYIDHSLVYDFFICTANPKKIEVSKQTAIDNTAIDNEPSSASSSSYSKPSQVTEAQAIRYDRPVPGSTLRCLEDPVFESDINSPPNRSGSNIPNDELNKVLFLCIFV